MSPGKRKTEPLNENHHMRVFKLRTVGEMSEQWGRELSRGKLITVPSMKEGEQSEKRTLKKWAARTRKNAL